MIRVSSSLVPRGHAQCHAVACLCGGLQKEGSSRHLHLRQLLPLPPARPTVSLQANPTSINHWRFDDFELDFH